MDPVVHFEMPYEDKQRAADFYRQAFGWKAQLLGPEMGEYVVVQTDETDEKGMLSKTNRINGGLYKKSDDPATHVPSVVIAVNDIDEARKKIELAGGRVLGEPMEIPGIGLYVGFTDTEGNRVGMLKPSQDM